MVSDVYYTLKPVIPRRLQLLLRRYLIRRKRAMTRDIWPIDPKSAQPPPNWTGWPDRKQFAVVLTHDVETARGQEKCYGLIQLEKELGFRSSFNFVPRRYNVSPELRRHVTENQFEVGIHGLYHDGKYYQSLETFQERAIQINKYLEEWKAVGFRTPFMLHNLDWIHELNIEYDASTFDTDPFEPQPDGVGTIFPFRVSNGDPNRKGYTELPYTLPQDFTLFVLMQEKNIAIWKTKLDWIAKHGGMVLLNTHPDYMYFGNGHQRVDEYPVGHYRTLLTYLQDRYRGQYWHALPREMARFWAISQNEKIGHDGTNFHHDEHSRGTKNNSSAARIHPAKQEREILDEAATPAIGAKSYPGIRTQKTIWIDLDNSPHVPFFFPIIRELKNNGYAIAITARDCFQVCELADLYKLEYRTIGRHHGKNKILKIFGLAFRALQLLPHIRRIAPDLALSHGSRSQEILATLLRIPRVSISDYEHARKLPYFHPDWNIVPEVAARSYMSLGVPEASILTYPGLKEDVYAPDFKPNPMILDELEIKKETLIVTARPPATEAHYHNPESELLFDAVIDYLATISNLRIVLLPRNGNQKLVIEKTWPHLVANGKIIIPNHVIDGLNLIWFSDLVISGGGTMNREAAALGVPVYSVFRGKIGAVDHYLAQSNRLILLESVEEIPTKLKITRRNKSSSPAHMNRSALKSIVETIMHIASD